MKVIVTPAYLLFVFISVFGLIASIYLTVPVWAIAVLFTSLAIILLHEWTHVYAAQKVGISVNTVILDLGNNTTFLDREKQDDPESDKKEAMVFLAGAVFDSVFWLSLITFLVVNSILSNNVIELIIACILAPAIIWGFNFEWSDYRQYQKRIGA
jgi:hypothetical protein